MVKLNEIFHIEYGQSDYTSKLFLKENVGTIPLISSKGTENGVYGFFNIVPKYEHVISVPRTGTVGHAFYQGWKCCIDDNCLVLIPKKDLSINEMIYFVLLIRKEKYKYMYGRQITPKRLGGTEIPDKMPDWVYNFKVSQLRNLSKPKIDNKPIELKRVEWKEFYYHEIFEVKKGRRVTKMDLRPGKTPFIGAIDSSNGYREFCDLPPLFDGNVITVPYNGNGVGEAFYQPDPFWASDDINVLVPKFELNPYIAMFIITIIRKEKYRFNYGRKWHKERMEQSTIKLPVKNGKPDWEYMSDFIKAIPYSNSI